MRLNCRKRDEGKKLTVSESSVFERLSNLSNTTPTFKKMGGVCSTRTIERDRTNVRPAWLSHLIRGEVDYGTSEIGRIARHLLIQNSNKLVVQELEVGRTKNLVKRCE